MINPRFFETKLFKNTGLRETQEMLDFCAEKGILPDIEVINMQDIQTAYDRMEASDIKYRFVIDMESLRG